MMTLSNLSILTGVAYCFLHLPLLVAPALVKQGLVAFPRNRWAGGVLAVVALTWSAVQVNDMPLGMLDAYKGWLWALGPAVLVLVLVFMDELLAVRALGGLLMLAACPVLETQRLCDTGWTWVPALMAYLWVVAGMVLVLSPYRFRHAVERGCATEGLTRVMGAGGVVMGGLLIALGLLVF
jgi:hypothetical protein